MQVFEMKTNNKIKQIREQKNLSQEQIAERLQMSPSGYAKIERGETRLHLDKLQQIAQVFNIDVFDLMPNDTKNIIVNINENGEKSNHINYATTSDVLAKEIENLKNLLSQKDLLIQEKDHRLAEKDQQIQTLNEMINLLKK